MISKYLNRIMVVNRDDVVLNVESVMKEVFEFIGLEWRSDYLKMTTLKKKFANYGEQMIDYIAFFEWNSSRLSKSSSAVINDWRTLNGHGYENISI